MAEAVLQVALDNLSSLIQKRLGLFLGVNQEMKRLSRILTTIKAVLEDAEEKQLTNRALQDWLQKLKDASHFLDDILDECATEALGLEYQGFNGGLANHEHGSCLSSFHPNHVSFTYKIAKKMKEMRERLDEIAEERINFHLREAIPERRIEIKEWRQTTSIISQPQVYGREEEKEKIVDFLVGHASYYKDLSVYPIIGMGGLGKTTLAQLVFNHERVANHFELKIWVCVSEDFSMKRMLKVIIESASGHASEDLDLEPLQKRLQELLGTKRYLLVLDDVWDDDPEKWDKLRCVLNCGSKGASILVTTRLAKVASIMGTMPPHQLSILSEDDCWEVFKQRAFGINKGRNAELEAIGKEIVKKCKGVPLAAKSLGSLLLFKDEKKDWLHILESKLWSLPQDENSIMPALRLSYLDLPVNLRQCFAFCALFPKDEEIEKKFLIQLWMANGFISSHGTLEMEDIGAEVWNELYWRSFFQEIEIDHRDGNIRCFKMHDLIHDLAQSVSKEECCYIKNGNDTVNLSERARHLSIYVDSLSLHSHQVKSLKTYIMRYHYGNPCSPDTLMKCYSLRVLDMKCLDKVSSSISDLKHLRYLNLSNGSFKTLPDSICRLWNLQILDLSFCYDLQKLPNRLRYLKSLRQLYLHNCKSLSRLAPKIGQLTSLRTLDLYIVGKQRGFQLKELGCLNLKGALHIKHLERVRSVMDAKEANLAGKHLINLELSWERNEKSQLQENAEKILEVLQPNTQLKFLTVQGYMGAQFPQWMGSLNLKDLFCIELEDCENCLHLSPLKKLPSLRRLRLSNMNHVQYVDDESYNGGVAGGFRALEVLMLEKLPNLLKLSKVDRENMFPCLLRLQIADCSKLSLHCLPSLTELKIVQECNQPLLGSIQNLQSLQHVWFVNNNQLTSFSNEMLQGLANLKELHIYNHDKLEVLPTEIMNSNALEELHLKRCNNLETLTEHALQGLHSLKRLNIGWYPNLELSSGFQYLTALEDLIIGSCPKVDWFPEALLHITTLQSLSLYDLPNLACLPDWLGNLALLQSLFISNCPKLMSLPTSIQCLRNLRNLEIYGCPELLKRCKEETGEDWHKIVHVPRIHLREFVVIPKGLGEFFYNYLGPNGWYWNWLRY